MSRPRVTVLTRDQGFAPLGWLYAFKAHAKNVIAQILPEPQASPLTGILLGDDSGLPKSVQDAFRTTGTSHVIAISGYNVAIFIGILSTVTIDYGAAARILPDGDQTQRICRICPRRCANGNTHGAAKVRGKDYCGFCATENEKLLGWRSHLICSPDGVSVIHLVTLRAP